MSWVPPSRSNSHESVVLWSASVPFLNCCTKCEYRMKRLCFILHSESLKSFICSTATAMLTSLPQLLPKPCRETLYVCCFQLKLAFNISHHILGCLYWPFGEEDPFTNCSLRSWPMLLQKMHFNSRCKVGHRQIQMSPTSFIFLPVLHNMLNLPREKIHITIFDPHYYLTMPNEW